MKFRQRGFRALVVALVAATSLSTITAAEAALPEQSTSAGRLGQYLYYNAHHFATVFDGTSYPDYGLTVDGVLAMDAAHVGQAESVRATEYVAEHVNDYIQFGSDHYAGATAKALLLSEAQQVTPAGTLGGVDLVARLKSLETDSGRFSDTGETDYSNTFGQSFALIALSRAGETLSAKSISYLFLQQCPNGGFRIALGGTACTTNSSADTDATSMAMQGMLAMPSSTSERTSRLSRAFYYLKSQMGSDGGVKGGSPTNTPNANSTGLAVASMKATDHPTYAAKGATYLKNLRYGCKFASTLRGLVAYDATRRAQALKAGSSAKLNDQDLRTTTQAVLGFAGVPYVSVTKTGASSASPKFAC